VNQIPYFAYGSNLSEAGLAEKNVVAAAPLFATLRGYHFDFGKRSNRPVGSSRADLVASPGRMVVGGFYLLPPEDFARIAGAEKGYVQLEVEVELPDEQYRKVKALTFVAADGMRAPEALPPAEYVEKILAGLARLGGIGDAAGLVHWEAAGAAPAERFPVPGRPDAVSPKTLTGLASLLVLLRKGTIPAGGYDAAALGAFLKSARRGQRRPFGNYPNGSWALLADAEGDNDVRFELVTWSTALVASILTAVRARHPVVAAQLKGLDETLAAALDFHAQTSLTGHGYEAAWGSLRLIRAFDDGGVLRLLVDEPDLSPRLLAALRELRDAIAATLPSAPPRPDWSNPARWEVEDALARLAVLGAE
jgi:hypothetical protein